jgi:hypothetical protein
MRGGVPSVTALTIRSSGTSLASPKPPLSSNVSPSGCIYCAGVGCVVIISQLVASVALQGFNFLRVLSRP